MLKIIALTLLAILAIFAIARLARRPAVARRLGGFAKKGMAPADVLAKVSKKPEALVADAAAEKNNESFLLAANKGS